jgi:hypothetical protein
MVVRFDRGVNHHLGSHLARRELRIALRDWHRRAPDHTLASEYRFIYLPPLRYVPACGSTTPPRSGLTPAISPIGQSLVSPPHSSTSPT